MKIKDYLVLKEIESYLTDLSDEKTNENNGFTNNPIEELTKLINSLRKIIYKLEEED